MKNKLVRKVVLFGILIMVMGTAISVLKTRAIRDIGPIDPDPVSATYSGYVRDNSGNGLYNAKVQLISYGSVCATDYTSSSGYYSFTTEVVSSPGLRASKSGYVTETKSVSSSGGSYNFYLDSNSPPPIPVYTGYIKDTSGIAIEGATVKLISSGSVVHTYVTSSTGYYRFDDDYVSSPQIEASATNYITQTKTVSSSGGTYNFNLVYNPPIEWITISGYVFDESGYALEHAEIRVFDQNGLELAYTTACGDGFYEITIQKSNDKHYIQAWENYYYDDIEYYASEFEIIPSGDISNFDMTIYQKPEGDMNIGDNFDSTSLEENGWEIETNTDSPRVKLVDIVGNGLTKYYPSGNCIQLAKNSDVDNAIVRKNFADWEHPITSYETTMISAKVAYACEDEDSANYAYMEIGFNYAESFIIRFYDYDTTLRAFENLGQPLYDSLTDNRFYQVDILLEKDTTENEIDFSVYIDGECVKYGDYELGSSDLSINKLEFGLKAISKSEFYIDNIYLDNPQEYYHQDDITYLLASPITWVLSPEVSGVSSQFIFRYEESTTVSLNFFVGQTVKNLFFSSGINGPTISILDWFPNYENEYSVIIYSDDSDVIVHVRHEFTIDKKEIWMQNGVESAKYLDVTTDIEYQKSRFSHLTSTQYQNAFGYAPPANPRNSGYTPIAIHKKTYLETEGDVGEYPYEAECSNTISIGASINLGFRIGASINFAAKTFAKTRLNIDLSVQPLFEYGLPNENTAYMGVQPYIVKELPDDGGGGGGGDPSPEPIIIAKTDPDDDSDPPPKDEETKPLL